MNKYRLFAAVLLASTSLISHATPRTIIGAGTVSCGKYLELAKDKAVGMVISSWALGYISASNSLALPFDALQYTDGDAITAALKLYCEKNPLMSVADAAADTALQIAVRASDQIRLEEQQKRNKK